MFRAKIAGVRNVEAITIQFGKITGINFPSSPVIITKICFGTTNWLEAREWIEELLLTYYGQIQVQRDNQHPQNLLLLPAIGDDNIKVHLYRKNETLVIEITPSVSDRIQQEFADILDQFHRKQLSAFLSLADLPECRISNLVRFDHVDRKKAA